MTTIAYHHDQKKVAVDGRVTSDYHIITDNRAKFKEVNDEYFFGAGSGGDWIDLVDIFLGNGSAQKENYDCTVLMIKKDGSAHVIIYQNGEIDKWHLDCNYAIGSGTPWATAAMDFGKSAEESVTYAATRDNFTGGQIYVLDIKNMQTTKFS